MSAPIRFGILGCGSIAHKFAQGIRIAEGAELYAVASRTTGKAASFAEHYAEVKACDSYESLLECDEVDVVYVATTHNFHYECVKLALDYGKPVICEKPFTVNAREARALINQARQQKLFLMEAMWTRYLPPIVKVREWLDEGRIGEVRHMRADLGGPAPYEPESRLFNRALAGGALLDLGCYTLSLASMVFGQKPTHMESVASIGNTGVDEQASVILRYPTHAIATLTMSLTSCLKTEAVISGEKGSIVISPYFHGAHEVTLYNTERTCVERFEHVINEENGFSFQIEEVVRCLREGEMESAVMPLDETLQLMEQMDSLRKAWGLTYAQDTV